MRILRPETLDAAREMIADSAMPVAGGTGLALKWSQGVAKPGVMAEIGHLLPRGITRHDDGSFTIGAATPLQDIRTADLPLMSEGARDVAAPNIRRLATLGGTIGFGAGCLLPAMLSMNARLATTAGACSLADYLADPKGLVLSVHLTPGTHHIWRKVGLRAGFTAALLVTSGTLVMDDNRIVEARLAIGGGPVKPRRIPGVEAWLSGQVAPEIGPQDLATRIADEIDVPSCAFRSADYRRRVAAMALTYGITGLPARPGRLLRRPTPAKAPSTTHLSRAEGGSRWQTRPDMPAKVRGQMQYLTDYRSKDLLIGRVLRAGLPHAEILSIDTTEAEALPGVRAIVTHRDVPGLNAFGIVFQDQPAFCDKVVRYEGDAIAAVAAVDEETAEKALSLIRVEYRPLPLVTDPEEALKPDAPQLHETGNLAGEVGLSRGDLERGFAEAVHIVEDTYTTPRQMHGFMETEGGWVAPEGDGLLVCVGGQHGARDRMQLSRILNMPEEKIRIVSSPIGGGFGGKDELTVQPALALLALKAQAPVRMQLSRAESVLAGTKRNPMRIHMKTGCDARGRLVAQKVDLISDCGAYASLSPGVMETAMEHCAGPYIVENIQTRGRVVYTNNGAGGAFRGFGGNQMTYAIECQMDRLAEKAGLDPIAIRRLNLRKPRTPGYLGQKVAPTERLSEMLGAAAASDIWEPFDVGDDEIPGVGMGLNLQGTGLGTIPQDDAHFAMRLKDGKIEVLCGLDEMGQGMIASIHASAALKLGCAREDIRVIYGDTGRAPDSGSTTAARGGYVVWKGVELTTPGLEKRMLARAAEILNRPTETLHILPGGIGGDGSNAPLIALSDLGDLEAEETFYEFPKANYFKGNARFIFCYGATLARIAVNRITGQIRIPRVEFHSAAGPVIDMASYLGQMEGGLIQGIGFSLNEDALIRDGRLVTKNFDSYVMPSIRDTAEQMITTAHEELEPDDPYGPRGVGELSIGAVAPALANAVADAIGHWPSHAPFSPEEILRMVGADLSTETMGEIA